jgi:hypothetical protein
VGDGGDLATLTSQAENDWVTSTLLSTLASDAAIWMGLTDHEALTSTVTTSPYAWISGETVSYTNWSPSGQPDHACWDCPPDRCCQHRGAMGTNGEWMDRGENDTYDSLCEAAP